MRTMYSVTAAYTQGYHECKPSDNCDIDDEGVCDRAGEEDVTHCYWTIDHMIPIAHTKATDDELDTSMRLLGLQPGKCTIYNPDISSSKHDNVRYYMSESTGLITPVFVFIEFLPIEYPTF